MVKGIEVVFEVCKVKVLWVMIVLMVILLWNDGECVNVVIYVVNEQIVQLVDGKWVWFFLINDQLVDVEGKFFEGVIVDKLYLLLKGYEIWVKNLKLVLIELLGLLVEIDFVFLFIGDLSVK